MANPARHVLVIGSLNADLVMRAPRLPHPGETVGGARFSVVPGGKGANQAVAAARAGAPVTMIGRVGDDDFGRLARAELIAAGVNVDYVQYSGKPTGTAQIVIDSAGRNTIVVAPGANSTLTRADVEGAANAWKTAGLVVLQLEIPLSTVVAAARQASARGVPLLLNAAPAMPLPNELVTLVDWLLVNETEAEALADRRLRSVADAVEVAAMLRRRSDQRVVITLGAAGAILVGEGERRHAPALEVDVVDTTAAGDAFAGALAAAVLRQRPAEEALRRAVAAGSLACTRVGAIPSLPTAAEIDRLTHA